MKKKPIITGDLYKVFFHGKKIKLSETVYGDTFLYDGFGYVELYMNINAWKSDGQGKLKLEPWNIVSLHPGNQGFGMPGDTLVVLVNTETIVTQAELKD